MLCNIMEDLLLFVVHRVVVLREMLQYQCWRYFSG